MLTKRSNWTVLCLLAAWFAISGIGHPVESIQTPRNSTQEPLVSLDLKNVTLTDVMAELGKAYKVNVVADAYLDDPHLGGVQISGAPLSIALEKLAQLYDRNLTVVNGIVVLRHRRWYLRKAQEEELIREFHRTWSETGQVSLERIENLPDGKAAAALISDDPLLPARWLSLEVQAAPLEKVASEFSAQIGWTLKIAPGLEQRRISAHLHRVTPGQVLEALTWLMSARQEVTIGQSDAQRKQEAELMEDFRKGRTARDKMSDTLKSDLMRLLSPQQCEQLDHNQQVEIPLYSLPPRLQERAMQYIRLAYNSLPDNAQSFFSLDETRFLEFRLVLDPDPQLGISINGFDTNGLEVGF